MSATFPLDEPSEMRPKVSQSFRRLHSHPDGEIAQASRSFIAQLKHGAHISSSHRAESCSESSVSQQYS